MPGTITLKEVLEEMDSGRPFDIQVVQLDRRRGTGGQLRTYYQVVKSGTNGQRMPATHATDLQVSQVPKNPKHYENSTRNLYNEKERDRAKQRPKIHIRLITQFNGKRVL